MQPTTVLSPLAFHDGADGFKSYGSAFAYAEIEKFFPESLEELTTVSYTIETPPFPSEYSAVKRDDLSVFDNPELLNDLRRVLRNPDDEYSALSAKFLGFETVEEVLNMYALAPSEEVIAFAKYSNVFKDERKVYELKPMVVYYWT